MGDSRRPGSGDGAGAGDSDGGGYRPRLLPSQRRTRRDGRDRRTCYSAWNSGASSEGFANGDVAYDVWKVVKLERGVNSDSGWLQFRLRDIFDEMRVAGFFIVLLCCGRRCTRPHGNVILLSNAGETGEVAVAGFVIWRGRAHTQLQGQILTRLDTAACRRRGDAYATVSRDVLISENLIRYQMRLMP